MDNFRRRQSKKDFSRARPKQRPPSDRSTSPTFLVNRDAQPTEDVSLSFVYAGSEGEDGRLDVEVLLERGDIVRSGGDRSSPQLTSGLAGRQSGRRGGRVECRRGLAG